MKLKQFEPTAIPKRRQFLQLKFCGQYKATSNSKASPNVVFGLQGSGA
jgi:hypothetical protein